MPVETRILFSFVAATHWLAKLRGKPEDRRQGERRQGEVRQGEVAKASQMLYNFTRP
jgi:hypothetical protein